MTDIQGFVASVPAGNRALYRARAAEAATLSKEFGATRVASPLLDA
jgi:uncharacterized protein YbaA (DUF1428 family)